MSGARKLLLCKKLHFFALFCIYADGCVAARSLGSPLPQMPQYRSKMMHIGHSRPANAYVIYAKGLGVFINLQYERRVTRRRSVASVCAFQGGTIETNI